MENTVDDDDDDDDVLLLLHGDVLIGILVWLPVISLLRFKSVCKSWRALFESSFFIHLHNTTSSSSSSSSNKFGPFIFQTSLLHDSSTEARTFMLTSNTTTSRRSGAGGGAGNGDDEVFEVEDLGIPPLNEETGDLLAGCWWMVGSCNGLICSTHKWDVSLWNPATKQFRILPKSSITLEEEEEEEEVSGGCIRRIPGDAFGFGFDVENKDYKVVQIRPMFSSSLPGSGNGNNKCVDYRVQVYSLSTDSWRVFFSKDSARNAFDMGRRIYLNHRSFFFHGTYGIQGDRKRRRDCILSFDFTKEILTPIPLFPTNSTSLVLTYFGADKIAFIEDSSTYSSSSSPPRTDFAYDIWVLNEHEHEHEEESYYWTKLQHSIRISKWGSDYIFPKLILGDGKFALLETRCGNDRKLKLFNLVTKEEKTVSVYPTGMGLLRVGVYNPSLVSIIGGGGGGGGGNGNGSAACSGSS